MDLLDYRWFRTADGVAHGVRGVMAASSDRDLVILDVDGENFAHLPQAGKILLSFCMLLGRLEIFTLLVLFTPAFWRI